MPNPPNSHLLSLAQDHSNYHRILKLLAHTGKQQLFPLLIEIILILPLQSDHPCAAVGVLLPERLLVRAKQHQFVVRGDFRRTFQVAVEGEEFLDGFELP